MHALGPVEKGKNDPRRFFEFGSSHLCGLNSSGESKTLGSIIIPTVGTLTTVCIFHKPYMLVTDLKYDFA